MKTSWHHKSRQPCTTSCTACRYLRHPIFSCTIQHRLLTNCIDLRSQSHKCSGCRDCGCIDSHSSCCGGSLSILAELGQCLPGIESGGKPSNDVRINREEIRAMTCWQPPRWSPSTSLARQPNSCVCPGLNPSKTGCYHFAQRQSLCLFERCFALGLEPGMHRETDR